MNLQSLITDNVAELLVKIIDFTNTRQKLLYRNITNIDTPDFVPCDLPVHEFSDLLDDAISEHIRAQRLVLCDTDNISFGLNGSFDVKPVPDKSAASLLRENRNEYLELQVNKLLENSLNQRIAAELLKQKQGMTSLFE
ncbi:MAG: hypothetical protein ACYS4W_12490 [Planctomycetota bacterium]|jgi:flagellar basal body rod protein FlgB